MRAPTLTQGPFRVASALALGAALGFEYADTGLGR
jgi:hypothetical protein